jgi:hypothetical protein
MWLVLGLLTLASVIVFLLVQIYMDSPLRVSKIPSIELIAYRLVGQNRIRLRPDTRIRTWSILELEVAGEGALKHLYRFYAKHPSSPDKIPLQSISTQSSCLFNVPIDFQQEHPQVTYHVDLFDLNDPTHYCCTLDCDIVPDDCRAEHFEFYSIRLEGNELISQWLKGAQTGWKVHQVITDMGETSITISSIVDADGGFTITHDVSSLTPPLKVVTSVETESETQDYVVRDVGVTRVQLSAQLDPFLLAGDNFLVHADSTVHIPFTGQRPESLDVTLMNPDWSVESVEINGQELDIQVKVKDPTVESETALLWNSITQPLLRLVYSPLPTTIQRVKTLEYATEDPSIYFSMDRPLTLILEGTAETFEVELESQEKGITYSVMWSTTFPEDPNVRFIIQKHPTLTSHYWIHVRPEGDFQTVEWLTPVVIDSASRRYHVSQAYQVPLGHALSMQPVEELVELRTDLHTVSWHVQETEYSTLWKWFTQEDTRYKWMLNYWNGTEWTPMKDVMVEIPAVGDPILSARFPLEFLLQIPIMETKVMETRLSLLDTTLNRTHNVIQTYTLSLRRVERNETIASYMYLYPPLTQPLENTIPIVDPHIMTYQQVESIAEGTRYTIQFEPQYASATTMNDGGNRKYATGFNMARALRVKPLLRAAYLVPHEDQDQYYTFDVECVLQIDDPENKLPFPQRYLHYALERFRAVYTEEEAIPWRFRVQRATRDVAFNSTNQAFFDPRYIRYTPLEIQKGFPNVWHREVAVGESVLASVPAYSMTEAAIPPTWTSTSQSPILSWPSFERMYHQWVEVPIEDRTILDNGVTFVYTADPRSPLIRKVADLPVDIGLTTAIESDLIQQFHDSLTTTDYPKEVLQTKAANTSFLRNNELVMANYGGVYPTQFTTEITSMTDTWTSSSTVGLKGTIHPMNWALFRLTPYHFQNTITQPAPLYLHFYVTQFIQGTSVRVRYFTSLNGIQRPIQSLPIRPVNFQSEAARTGPYRESLLLQFANADPVNQNGGRWTVEIDPEEIMMKDGDESLLGIVIDFWGPDASYLQQSPTDTELDPSTGGLQGYKSTMVTLSLSNPCLMSKAGGETVHNGVLYPAAPNENETIYHQRVLSFDLSWTP